jgi:hypothetical protein
MYYIATTDRDTVGWSIVAGPFPTRQEAEAHPSLWSLRWWTAESGDTVAASRCRNARVFLLPGGAQTVRNVLANIRPR